MTEEEQSKPTDSKKDTITKPATVVSAESEQSTAPKGNTAKVSPKIKFKAASTPFTVVNLFLAFCLLVVCITCAGGWWLWQQYTGNLQTLTANQGSLAVELESYQSQLLALEKANIQSSQQWQQAYSQLEQLVVSSAQHWNREVNRTQNRWPLEEALTLMRLAQQRLQLDSSQKVTLGLLASADTILAGLDQAAVLPIRRQLASDVLALKTVNAADVNGLYFQLEAISGEIKNLSWVPKPNIDSAIERNANPAEGFWQSLKTVFVISRQDIPFQAPALQSDFERWRQHSLLLLEQIQLALLAHNQNLFNAAIVQTADYLNMMQSQFDTATWTNNLNAMQTVALNPIWPDIQASIDTLELYLSEQPAAVKSSSETTTQTTTPVTSTSVSTTPAEGSQ